MKKKKILYGVCGIGNGHMHRQLPLIEYFSRDYQIVIFAYDTSFHFYRDHFKDYPFVTVLEVAVPFYVGSRTGIDFEATKKLLSNKKDYEGINGRAITITEQILGVPDLVITDYEPISASYAYSHQVPLVTIDQQSKYLAGEFPTELHGQTYADEVARLKMFFPTATARIACSFFDVKKKKDGDEVQMFPPILREEIFQMKNIITPHASLLVYLSSQKEFHQDLEEIFLICSRMQHIDFHIFSPQSTKAPLASNVHVYVHGDRAFGRILKNCAGIVATAGHTLLSEAMHLSIPVYAIPLAVYEQQMNAEVIDKNGFGVRSETINEESLNYFIAHLSHFRDAIKKDRTVLLRGNGKEKIIAFLQGL